MRRPVVFHAQAEADFDEIFAWIADHAGMRVAEGYTERLWAFCGRLEHFPQRGHRRDDLAPGVRVIGFERRVTIFFTVTDDAVVILRLLYGGRSLESAFTDPDEA